MGLIDEFIERAEPNASKCLTNTAMKATIKPDRVLEMRDIHGLLVFLLIGLGVALVTFVAEKIRYSIRDMIEKEKSKHARERHVS